MDHHSENRQARISALLICVLTSIVLLFYGLAIGAQTKGVRVTIKDRQGKPVGLYSESHALLIGVSKYTNGWPRLESVPGEIDRVEKALRRQGFDVKKVMDPDSDKLFDAFDNFIDDYGFDRNNRLLFFYSGHGHTRKQGNKGYLVPADAPDPRDDERGFYRKSLGMNQILTWSRRIEAKHALFLFDSCFSGTIFKSKALPKHPPYISHITARPVRQYISAGSAGEEVPAKSVFTPLVIRALEGKGDLDRDGYVTGTELGLYLQKEVTQYDAGQHSQYGKIRDPDLDEGDFVFLLASSGAVIDTSAPSSTATQGRLSVSSNVTGAQVIVDGKFVGGAPLMSLELSAGSHRVQVKKDGYDTYRTNVEITSGRLASLEAYLTEQGPKTARLYVDTTPSDARIRILNIGPKYYQGMELSPGDYHLEVSASGHGKQTRWVSLAAGEDKRISFSLSGGYATAPPMASGTPATTTPKSRITNSLGMEFVYIKPGTFMMGSPSNEPKRGKDERQHQVTLTQGYYLQTTEVTQGQWQQVMGGNPSKFKNCGSDCPVEQVSWDDAQKFIQKLNRLEGTDKYRLPTEAEWEYAARAGTQTPFSFGDCLSTNQANYDGNSPMPGCGKGKDRKKPVTVGSFPANAWGLYDMHGNVYEWCQDWFGDYPTGAVSNPKGPSSGENRVFRGGGWNDYARYCRSAYRDWLTPGFRNGLVGLRLVRTN